MSAPLTPERLAEYAALVQAATEGPWQVIVDQADDGFPPGAIGVATEDETFVFSESRAEILWVDAEFAAVARTAVPELLAEVARLQALVTAMHAAAMGEVKPPLLGLVEDVAATRSALAAQQQRADTLDGIAREMALRVAELEDAAYGDATVRLLEPVEQIQHLHAAVAAQMARADTLNRLALQHRARVTELEAAAPHRFEAQFQTESDAKRRFANCKHCRGARTDARHAEAGESE